MSASITAAPPAVSSKRLVSLDVLRGITIAFMILVNSSGDRAYWPLHHADWNGWTPTDLVFPTFLFVVGASVVFSFESRLSRGASKAALLRRAVRRSIVLFLLGLLVNGFPFFHLETLRVYGVLQRIAICFLLASLLYLWLWKRPPGNSGTAIKIALVSAAALVGYWILMRWVTVPGYGLPGRDIPFLDKNANLAAYLDRRIFPGRLYEGTRDPEGLLSTLPAMATTLIGMLTALWLRNTRSTQRKCAGIFGSGILLILLGELWSFWFPINKKLWTSSYALLAAGVALVAWALLYWLIEIREWKGSWTYFWKVFGVNAITAYVFSELLSSALWELHARSRPSPSQLLYSRFFAPINPPAAGALFYSLCFVLICWLPALALYRKGIILKA